MLKLREVNASESTLKKAEMLSADSKMNYLYIRNTEEGPVKSLNTEQIKVRYINLLRSPNIISFLLYFNNVYIGECSITLNDPSIDVLRSTTALINIVIADKEFVNRGIGKSVYKTLESIALENNVQRLIANVFEFNQTAISFFNSRGFVQYTEIKDYTYYNSKWWKDISLEKYIR